MIRYKKYQVTGEDSPLKGLWYARPVIEETFDIEKLAKHMSNHNTPYSSGVIKGVLADMVSCTKDKIQSFSLLPPKLYESSQSG